MTDRRLRFVLHGAFFLILAACLTRYLLHHHGQPEAPWIVALSSLLAVIYLVRPVVGEGPVWLAVLTGIWAVLVVLAPSFAWCAVPLIFSALRMLRPLAAVLLVGAATVLATAAQLRLAAQFDPVSAFAPLAVAAVATALFLHLQGLIDDLIRTRRELAATERREGTLAERERLSMEIHDTLAQGLSSQQMMLQAADRLWDVDPATARAHVRNAAGVAEHSLAEARRFVHDLAPVDLAAGSESGPDSDPEPGSGSGPGSGPGSGSESGSDGCASDGERLAGALAALARRETALPVTFRQEGPAAGIPERAQAALLRIAQGALANVREHAGAERAALTLTFLGDQVVLDIADDGRGFAAEAGPDAEHRRDPTRGHGLPAMRARMAQLGGTLTVESSPDDGTVVTATVPLDPSPESTP